MPLNINFRNKSSAFTIVELLIGIVIIGILAAITFVSYSGLSLKAVSVSLISDLDSDVVLLKSYTIKHGYYPDSIDSNDCPDAPTADTRYCLKSSDGNDLTYTGGVRGFTLTDTNTASGLVYAITETGTAIAVSTFVRAWGGAGTDFGNSIIQTTDNGYALTGRTYNYGAGGADMFLAKYDSSGNLSWSKTWGGTGYENGSLLVQTDDGGFAVVGDTDYGTGGTDVFLAKYDSSGNLSWSKTWGGAADDDYGTSIIQTDDGGYAITGDTSSYGAGFTDMFLAKFDLSGNLSWSKTWGGTGFDNGASLVQTKDGGYAVTGDTDYGTGGTDMFLVKYDSSGNLSWSKTWGGTGIEAGYSLTQTRDSGYAVTGQTYSFGSGDSDMFLAKYDSSGNLSWSKTWGGAAYDYGLSLVQTNEGGYAVTGLNYSYGAGDRDMFLAKFNSSGNLSWSKTWGGVGLDYGNALVQTRDGGYSVTGRTVNFGGGGTDMFIAKYDASGTIKNCSSPMCQNISALTTSPSAIATSPTPTVTSPSITVTSPSPTVTTATPIQTTVVAP